MRTWVGLSNICLKNINRASEVRAEPSGVVACILLTARGQRVCQHCLENVT